MKSLNRTTCRALALIFLLSGSAAAQQGRLDTSFFAFGYLQPDFGQTAAGNLPSNNQILRDVAVEAGGGLIAVGHYTRNDSSNNTDCALYRTLGNGRELDNGIGLDSQRRLPLELGGSNTELCSSIHTLADGSLLVVGYTTRADDRLSGMVVRLNSDTTLDTSYFDNGVFIVNDQLPWLAPGESTVLIDSLLDAQGRLWVVGLVNSASQGRGLLLRFNADGSLDTGFGTDGGVALADFNPPRVSTSALAMDDQGRMVVMGTTNAVGFPRAGVLFRLLDDGSLDLSFGAGMNASFGNGGGGRGFVTRCDRVSSLLIDSAQRFLIGCEPDRSGNTPGPIRAAGVLRLLPNGQPDSVFGVGGLVEPLGFTSPMGTLDTPPRLALQDNGQILLAATLSISDTPPGNLSDIYVTRLNISGTVDASFGHSNGFSRLRFSIPEGVGGDAFADGLANLLLDDIGRVLLVGSGTNSSGSRTFATLARLGPADPSVNSGFLDPTFSDGDGFLTRRFPELQGPRMDAAGAGAALDASGRITVIGRQRFETEPSPTYSCGVFRTQPDGQGFDPGFAPPTGLRVLSLNPADSQLCLDLVVQSSGHTLIAGNSFVNGGASGTLTRLGADGSVDSSFYGNGVLETWTDLNFQASGRRASFSRVRLDRQGRVLLVGITSEGTGATLEQFGLVLRLDADGGLDQTFANGGILRLTTATNPRRIFLRDIAQNSDGTLLISGSEGQGDSVTGNQGGVIYKVLENGQPDGSFPGGGYLRLRPPASPCLIVTTIAIDSQGRLLMPCFPDTGTARQTVDVLRLLPNGAADLNFGIGGVARVNFNAPTNPASTITSDIRAVLPQSDDRVLVVGSHDYLAANAFGFSDIGVARLTENGAPDPEFGRFNGGNVFRLPTPASQFNEFPIGAFLQPDGRPVIVGSRFDQRPGAPTTDRGEVVLMRLSNVQPPIGPLEPLIFADGFEQP